MGYLEQLEKDIEDIRKLIKKLINKPLWTDMVEKHVPEMKGYFPDDKDLDYVDGIDTGEPEYIGMCILKLRKLLDEKMKKFEAKESIIMRKRLKLLELESMTWRKKEYEKVGTK